MPQYAIMRFAKQKGGAGALEAHHERTKEKYASNPDIDTSRSKYNFHIVKPITSYKKESDNRIAAAGCRTRKDSVRFVDTLITASPEFFRGKKRDDVKLFFQTAVDFLAQKIGKDNIFAATVHLDEKTPHMHLCFTPITADGRLSAKEIIGNRTQLTKWQDDFFAHMVKKFPDIERGESASVTGRRHIPTRVFKQAVNLSRQAHKIEMLLSDNNILTSGKSKVEAVALLHKFFPSAEAYMGQMKKYQSTIDSYAEENTELKKEVNASKVSIKERLDIGKLKQEKEQLQRFIDSIPQDLMTEIKQQQRLSPQKGRYDRD